MDVLCTLCVFQKLHSDLSCDHRLPELAQQVKQLSGNVESEESRMLADKLDVLSKRRADTVEQLAARQQAVDSCLNRWVDFDNKYQHLVATISALHARVDATKTLTAADAIVNIEQVGASECLCESTAFVFKHLLMLSYCSSV